MDRGFYMKGNEQINPKLSSPESKIWNSYAYAVLFHVKHFLRFKIFRFSTSAEIVIKKPKYY